MPLQRYFDDQIDQLFGFFAALEERVRLVRVAPDIREFLVKLLAGMQDDPAYHHVMFVCEAQFVSTPQYAAALLAEVRDGLAAWQEPLTAAGVQLHWPEAELAHLPEQEQLARCCSALADSFPPETGALVLVLLPARVENAHRFAALLEYLAQHTASLKAKYLCIDEQPAPLLEPVPAALAQRIGVQTFALAPATIEDGIREKLAEGKLPPREQRQYQAMLGCFAFARHDYAEAERLQERLLEELGSTGAGSERANAFYNLGNTLLSKGDTVQAERCFAEALDLALEHGVEALVPMALSNLGVALHRQGKVEDALHSFRIAQQTCRNRDADLLEAHVLDSLARIYQLERRPEEAAQCWRQALAIYDRLKSTAAAPIKESGRNDLLEKLKQLSASAQPVAPLHQAGAPGRR